MKRGHSQRQVTLTVELCHNLPVSCLGPPSFYVPYCSARSLLLLCKVVLYTSNMGSSQSKGSEPELNEKLAERLRMLQIEDYSERQMQDLEDGFVHVRGCQKGQEGP